MAAVAAVNDRDGVQCKRAVCVCSEVLGVGGSVVIT